MKKSWVWIIIIILVILVGGYIAVQGMKKTSEMAPVQPTKETQTTTAPTTASSATAPSNNIYLVKTDPTKGQYLTDFNGMTLYTYDKDTPGKSNCYNGCATAWPVYTSGATAESTFPTNITVVTRTDGSKQFAWKGMPLYYYVQDQKPGDITGDGLGGIWHIVKP